MIYKKMRVLCLKNKRLNWKYVEGVRVCYNLLGRFI